MSLEGRTTRYQGMLKHARPGGTVPRSTPMPMPMLQLPAWPLRIGEPMRALLILFFLLLLTTPVAAGQLEDADAAYKRGDYESAFRHWQPLAEQGDAVAQYNLGVMYGKGQGVPQDYAEAMKWYLLAAEQGFAFAVSAIGNMYYKGEGVPQDYAEAMKWYQRA
jgi:hypothetical protein